MKLLILPSVPDHQHKINSDGTLGCGCTWPGGILTNGNQVYMEITMTQPLGGGGGGAGGAGGGLSFSILNPGYENRQEFYQIQRKQQETERQLATERCINQDLRRDLQKQSDAIRAHRDARGDDRCWMDDEELYKTLPEGYTAPKRDCFVELKNCVRFIETRWKPGVEYVSSQREIEGLNQKIGVLENELKTARTAVDAYRDMVAELRVFWQNSTSEHRLKMLNILAKYRA